MILKGRREERIWNMGSRIQTVRGLPSHRMDTINRRSVIVYRLLRTAKPATA